MMNILRSTFSKNCRSGRSYGFSQSRRDFSSSGSPTEGSLFPPLAIVSTPIGFLVYIINDFVNLNANYKRSLKISEEIKYFRKLFKEKREETAELRKEIHETE